MRKLILAASLAACASPALAGASNFLLVNGTGAPLAELSIRRAGTQEWKPLAPGASPGARASVDFADPDCAFDIRGNVGGEPLTWAGVNLCGAKSVTLNRDGSAGPWVDYDQ